MDSQIAFYRRQSRECAAIARRLRFMRGDRVGDEVWAERARASFYMVRCLIAEAAQS